MDRSFNNNENPMGKSQIVDVSSKVMLASIIILFLIIVLVIILHFYAKWYWRRRIGNQSTVRRRFVFTPSQDQNVTLRQGLAASVMKALPIVTFSSSEFKDGLECAVCLSEVEEGEKARILPKCNHGFHVDCIDMWFQSHSTCPLCRNPVSVESSSSPVDSSDLESQSSPVNSENNNNGLLSVEATPSYPTNVMFWGNQTSISTRDSGEEETSSSSSSSSTSASSSPCLRVDRPLVIDIPDRLSHGFSFSSPPTTPSSTRRVSEDDLKSPVSSRFKSLCKLLSREKRVVPSSPSVDIEQGEAVGSSKMSSPAGYVIGTSTNTTGKERSPEVMNNI